MLHSRPPHLLFFFPAAPQLCSRAKMVFSVPARNVLIFAAALVARILAVPLLGSETDATAQACHANLYRGRDLSTPHDPLEISAPAQEDTELQELTARLGCGFFCHKEEGNSCRSGPVGLPFRDGYNVTCLPCNPVTKTQQCGYCGPRFCASRCPMRCDIPIEKRGLVDGEALSQVDGGDVTRDQSSPGSPMLSQRLPDEPRSLPLWDIDGEVDCSECGWHSGPDAKTCRVFFRNQTCTRGFLLPCDARVPLICDERDPAMCFDRPIQWLPPPVVESRKRSAHVLPPLLSPPRVVGRDTKDLAPVTISSAHKGSRGTEWQPIGCGRCDETWAHCVFVHLNDFGLWDHHVGKGRCGEFYILDGCTNQGAAGECIVNARATPDDMTVRAYNRLRYPDEKVWHHIGCSLCDGTVISCLFYGVDESGAYSKAETKTPCGPFAIMKECSAAEPGDCMLATGDQRVETYELDAALIGQPEHKGDAVPGAIVEQAGKKTAWHHVGCTLGMPRPMRGKRCLYYGYVDGGVWEPRTVKAMMTPGNWTITSCIAESPEECIFDSKAKGPNPGPGSAPSTGRAGAGGEPMI